MDSSGEMIEYNDQRRRFLLASCRLYYQLQEYLIKFPRFTRKYFVKNIQHLPDDQQFKLEKKLWLMRTPFSKISHTSLILAAYYFFLICLKYSFFIYYTTSHVNFKQPQANIVKVAGRRDDELRFACMVTNCTRLSEQNELAVDLIQLPVFSICQPQLARFYDPLIDLYQTGLMILTPGMFYVLMTSVLVPLVGLNTYTSLRLATFITCPNITRHLEAKRTKQHCLALAASFVNYHLALLSRNNNNNKSQWQFKPTIERTEANLIRIKRATKLINHHHCLPINSTKWWHEQLVLYSPMVSLAISSSLLVFTLIVHLWSRMMALRFHGDVYINYANFINQTQPTCSIWTELSLYNNSTNHRQQVKLTEIASNFDCIKGYDYFLTLFTSNVLFAFSLNAVYQTMNDIQLIMSELWFQLKVAAHLAANMQPGEQSLNLHPVDITRHKSMFAAIRQKLIDHSSYSLGFIQTRQLDRRANKTTTTKLDFEFACQEFALDLLDQFGCSPEVYADLLEKIQINYWNLEHSINEMSEPISFLLVFTWTFNFGFSLISVYMTNRVLNIGLLPIVANILTVMTLNVYIAAASVVHSSAKKLEPLYWSLICLNCGQRNARIKHWHRLALKQLESMDAKGGLAVHTLGINITYVRILEASFWTTSIILFAYSRR